MKIKYFKNYIFTTIILLLLLSCNNDDTTNNVEEGLSNSENVLKVIDTINFKGLKVIHRFDTPLIKTNEESNLGAKIGKSTNSTIQSIPPADFEEFFDYDDEVIDSLDKQLKDFPYSESDEENFQMIKKDFPDLTDEEIVENIETIENYYATSLDHTVHNDLKKNESKLKKGSKKISDVRDILKNLKCLKNALRDSDFSFTLGIRAFFKSLKSRKHVSTSAFKYFDGQNTQRDAFRHIIWSAYLAKYYFTVSSLKRRLEFAELIGNANETCKEDNSIDSESMDFHNNRIGRKILGDNTSRRKVFGFNVGLRLPSVGDIQNKARDIVFAGKYINTIDIEQKTRDILGTDKDTSVYFSQKTERDNIFNLERWTTQQGGFGVEQQWFTGDFNGDGKWDVGTVFDDLRLGSVDVHLSNTNSFLGIQRWATRQGSFGTNQQWFAGDFNGDGKWDVGKSFNDQGLGSVDIHVSNGSRFNIQRWATKQGAFGNEQQWFTGDFNGDGKWDVGKVFNDGGLGSVDVHVSNGSSFNMQRWATKQGAFGNDQQWFTGDFNGDGKWDVGKVFNDNGESSIDIHISNGSGFDIQRWTTKQGGFGSEQKWVAGDFNGDGKCDVGTFFNDSEVVSIDVHLSKGNGFLRIQRWASAQGGFGSEQKWFTGDFNNDGDFEMGKAFNDHGKASLDIHSTK